jgi:hypothetical protein
VKAPNQFGRIADHLRVAAGEIALAYEAPWPSGQEDRKRLDKLADRVLKHASLLNTKIGVVDETDE